MVIKAVLFDFGGVFVFHVNRKFAGILSKKLKLHKAKVLDFIESKVNALDKGSLSHIDFWKSFNKKFGTKIKLNEMMGLYESSFKLRKEEYEFIKKLSGKYIVGILSNMSDYLSNFINKKYNLSFLKYVFFSAKCKMIKPHKKFYVFAARRMKLKPSEIVFIDDKMNNVNGARKAGFKSFQYKSVSETKKKLKKLGIV